MVKSFDDDLMHKVGERSHCYLVVRLLFGNCNESCNVARCELCCCTADILSESNVAVSNAKNKLTAIIILIVAALLSFPPHLGVIAIVVALHGEEFQPLVV